MLDPARLRGYGLSPLQICGALQKRERHAPLRCLARRQQRNRWWRRGGFLDGAESRQRRAGGVPTGSPVYLSDVATIEDGPEEPA